MKLIVNHKECEIRSQNASRLGYKKVGFFRKDVIRAKPG
jgi:hypothetical protein